MRYFLKGFHQVHHAWVVLVMLLGLVVLVVDVRSKHVESLLVLHELSDCVLRVRIPIHAFN